MGDVFDLWREKRTDLYLMYDMIQTQQQQQQQNMNLH